MVHLTQRIFLVTLSIFAGVTLDAHPKRGEQSNNARQRVHRKHDSNSRTDTVLRLQSLEKRPLLIPCTVIASSLGTNSQLKQKLKKQHTEASRCKQRSKTTARAEKQVRKNSEEHKNTEPVIEEETTSVLSTSPAPTSQELRDGTGWDSDDDDEKSN